MFTIIISFAIGFVAYFSFLKLNLSNTWSIIISVLIMLGIQILISLIIRKKVNLINGKIQENMMQAQAKINRKINHMQQRQMTNAKQAQQLLEKDQAAAIHDCIKISKESEKYYLWNFLLKKQMNTMHMMFYFQLREFKKVDQLMAKALIIDARSIAIKAVRMYKNNDPKLDKFLAKKCSKFKNDDAVLLYALYSWILVKQEKYSQAAALLANSKNQVENQVLSDNYERLANGKIKHFSNANLGDLWYSLYLEEPKVKQQRMVQRGY